MAHNVARRTFLAQIAAPGLVAFAPAGGDSDAAVFAAARKQFLFPENVTYCNTGTLGASPRQVTDALAGAFNALSASCPTGRISGRWRATTGYQPLTEFRAEAGAFINATADEIAFTQNATIGMSMLANGSNWRRVTKCSPPIRHSGGIGSWRLRAKRGDCGQNCR